MDINAAELILTVEFDAIKKEIENLREWYFYEPKHEMFNSVYYEFLEKANAPNLTAKEKLNLAESYYGEAIVYLKHYYPMVRPDIEPPVTNKTVRASKYHKKEGKKHKKHRKWRRHNAG